jgi:pimeloyl-ACP methyl ester carboxylesterase
MQRLTLSRPDTPPLAGYLTGSSGPVLVLANGLGGPVTAFRHQIEYFAGRFRVLTWDYRGLYGSQGSTPPARVDVAAQAEDLEALLRSVTKERAVVVGWSMGVQVALELAARAPDSVRELVLISGAHGRPMTHLRVPFAGRLLPGLIERMRPYHRLGSRVVEVASRSRAVAEIVRRAHLVSPRLGTDEILELAREFTSLDLDVYLRTLAALELHDATPALRSLRVPTLVMTGARDPLFSPRLARKLTAQIARSELYIVPRATHYAPLEFPELVNARIERFLGSFVAFNGARTHVNGAVNADQLD